MNDNARNCEKEGIRLLQEDLNVNEDYQVPHVFVIGGASVR